MAAVAVSESQRHRRVQSSGAVASQRKERSFGSSKQEKCMPSLRTVEDENSHESVNRKSSSSIHDQKMLKVRIKLGSSDNLSVQKKAAIYSGLGLDASPSSSLDENPSESEGMSCGPIVIGLESPTRIIQVNDITLWVCLVCRTVLVFILLFLETKSMIYQFSI